MRSLLGAGIGGLGLFGREYARKLCLFFEVARPDSRHLGSAGEGPERHSLGSPRKNEKPFSMGGDAEPECLEVRVCGPEGSARASESRGVDSRSSSRVPLRARHELLDLPGVRDVFVGEESFRDCEFARLFGVCACAVASRRRAARGWP